MATETFTCSDCGAAFTLAAVVVARYPGWTPKTCMACRGAGAPSQRKGPGGSAKGTGRKARGTRSKGRSKGRSGTRELNLTLAEVLDRFTEGPDEGVFTDGSCSGNPGPGGWGMVWVDGGEVVEQRHGKSAQTTNNRMEMTAIIEALKVLPETARTTIWSDSRLCVQTLTEWAAGWQRLGWKRKTGPIKNLELVQEAYALFGARPHVELRWIAAHNGARWNEYADSLSTAFLRDTL